MMFEYLKFAWVALCFLVAALSFFKCAERRDWLLLTLALGITLLADYFLIIVNRPLIGVPVFCFAHVAYILRVSDNRLLRVFLPVVTLAALYGALYLPVNFLAAHCAVYALLFAVNIVLHFRWFKKCARLPRRNLSLALAGILLFALCDINVLLYNLPVFVQSMSPVKDVAYVLLWVFYLPSQALLACSAFGLR